MNRKERERLDFLLPPYYCVVWIETKRVLYRGQSEVGAAKELVPGTCYGKSNQSQEEADRLAERWAEHFGAPKHLKLRAFDDFSGDSTGKDAA